MNFLNRTRFPGTAFIDVDRNGVETLVFAMKATFDLGSDGAVEPAQEQCQLSFGDVFAGAPGSSSLIYESDANWGRQATDVAFIGYAYPQREGDRETDVELVVGDARKQARVFGDRHWTGGIAARISAPQPFERIPLVYERAFGGVDDSPEDGGDAESEVRNPAGVGLRARRSRRPIEHAALPNIEDPQALIQKPSDRPAPVGFTFVAKHWSPRIGYAGSYDERWKAQRMPLLPEDFDPRFYAAASEGLALPYLCGGEAIELRNLSPSRLERFELPRVDVQASFHVDASPQPVRMNLDAVVILASSARLMMVWHGAQPVRGLVDDVRWAMIEGGAP